MSFSFRMPVLAIVLVASGVGRAEAQRSKEVSTWHFSAENEGSYVRSEIPVVALRIISRDDGLRNLLDAQNPPQKEIPNTWLSTSSVHLKDKNENDIVVQGIGPVSGSNVTIFWIFHVNGENTTLLLEVVAHDLIIRQPRRQGYLTIDAISSTSSSVTTVSFQMRDGKYRKYLEQTEKLP